MGLTESFKIVIGADLSGATAALNGFAGDVRKAGDSAEKAFDGAASSAGRLPSALAPAGAAARNLQQTFERFKAGGAGDAITQTAKSFNILGQAAAASVGGINAAGSALKRAVPGANAAGFALTNVGRIAQDLPFGFLGIQNNLNPLLESFQRLKAETGSSSAAFKALGASLIGPAGIGLALSVVSGAILIFQNGISGFNKKSKEAKEAADDLAKSIRSIASIEGEATASVQGQLAQINALAGAVSNANLPYEERKRALTDLKDINKSYFGDLKIEDAATGKLTSTIQEYNKALINSAIQKQFIDEIAKVAKSISDSDERIQKAKDARLRATNDVAKVEKQSGNTIAQINSRTGELTRAATEASEKKRAALGKEADAIKALNVENETGTKLIEQRLQLEERLTRATEEGLKFKQLDVKTDKQGEDALKKRLDALEKIKDSLKDLSQIADLEELIFDLKVKILLRDAKKNGLSDDEIETAKRGFKLQLSEAFEKEAISLEASIKVKPQFVQRDERAFEQPISDFAKKLSKVPILTENQVRLRLGLKVEAPFDLVGEITKKLEKQLGKLDVDTKQILIDASVQLNETIKTGLADSFSGIGEGLGEAIGAGLDFSNILQPLVGAVSGLLSSIGKLMIQSGVKILLAKKALTLAITNPAVLIAGGIALVALAAALKKSFGSQKIGSFEKGGISSGPRSGYLAMLHGTELIIPMNKIDKRPSRGGIQGQAAVNIVLQAGSVIEGQALRLLLNRVDRSNGRLF